MINIRHQPVSLAYWWSVSAATTHCSRYQPEGQSSTCKSLQRFISVSLRCLCAEKHFPPKTCTLFSFLSDFKQPSPAVRSSAGLDELMLKLLLSALWMKHIGKPNGVRLTFICRVTKHIVLCLTNGPAKQSQRAQAVTGRWRRGTLWLGEAKLVPC